MDVSKAEDVKHLRDENARLKRLVADFSLDKDMLQSVIRKNSLGSHPSNVDLLLGTPSYRLHVMLRREALEVNHKKVQRVYREFGLTGKRRRGKRLERALQPGRCLPHPTRSGRSTSPAM
jgi:putative transposase